ncbi:hypothetical protein [Acinetobacter modestus]|uniref:hypothetical protein n=1 Tax=Acinetobacter modestus TaxID=1776740 RepID=UPI0030176846
MLVQINSELYARAVDIIQVKKQPDGKWVALVQHEHGVTAHQFFGGDVHVLIRTINEILKK